MNLIGKPTFLFAKSGHPRQKGNDFCCKSSKQEKGGNGEPAGLTAFALSVEQSFLLRVIRWDGGREGVCKEGEEHVD